MKNTLFDYILACLCFIAYIGIKFKFLEVKNPENAIPTFFLLIGILFLGKKGQDV